MVCGGDNEGQRSNAMKDDGFDRALGIGSFLLIGMACPVAVIPALAGYWACGKIGTGIAGAFFGRPKPSPFGPVTPVNGKT